MLFHSFEAAYTEVSQNTILPSTDYRVTAFQKSVQTKLWRINCTKQSCFGTCIEMILHGPFPSVISRILQAFRDFLLINSLDKLAAGCNNFPPLNQMQSTDPSGRSTGELVYLRTKPIRG